MVRVTHVYAWKFFNERILVLTSETTVICSPRNCRCNFRFYYVAIACYLLFYHLFHWRNVYIKNWRLCSKHRECTFTWNPLRRQCLRNGVIWTCLFLFRQLLTLDRICQFTKSVHYLVSHNCGLPWHPRFLHLQV